MHPLASELAPLMDRNVDLLHEVVARWVVVEDDRLNEPAIAHSARARSDAASIQARHSANPRRDRISARALLVLAGRRVGIGPKPPSVSSS
jgi:hypothetical protein